MMIYKIALVIHLLSIVTWMGGVAFVTMIVFPMILRTDNSLEQVLMFQGVEHRFVKIAKVLVIIAGASGLYMLYSKGFSFLSTFSSIAVWFMMIIWTVFTILLFYLEPILMKKIFPEDKKFDARQIFLRLQAYHWIVLTMSFTVISLGVWMGHSNIPEVYM